MLILGLGLSVFGIGFFCCLLFTLAAYALPCFVAVRAGLAAFHSGAGVVGAIIIAVVAGAAMLAIGQIIFAIVGSPIIRAIIALFYAVPATLAGYSVAMGLSQIGVPSQGWRDVFAVIGAVCVGVTAWVRMLAFVPSQIEPGAVDEGHSPSDVGNDQRQLTSRPTPRLIA